MTGNTVRPNCDGGSARQDIGWLSVSGLGAESAESYGRDSIAEEVRLVLPAVICFVSCCLGRAKRLKKKVDCRSPKRVILRLMYVASDTAAVH